MQWNQFKSVEATKAPRNPFDECRKQEIEQSIPNRFEKIVRQNPKQLAVKTRRATLSYFLLNQIANRVARTILSFREEGQEPIGLLLDHGIPTIAAILGTLKTGKICVPLDPSLPRDRLDYILENCQAHLLVTDNNNLSIARSLSAHVDHLVNFDEVDGNGCSENLGLSITPNALAYILYTSGSTGRPKGVMHNHRNVIHNAMRYAKGCNIREDDRITLLASLGTGQGTPTAFSALLTGATLCPFNIRDEGISSLAEWLMTEEITTYISAPTVFRQFVATLTEQESFPKLRMIRLGAEQIRRTDVELYKKHFSEHCVFGIFLSATETGNISQYFFHKDTEITGDIVPVGYPVQDMEILLLDEAGQEVKKNQLGEIAVRSCYLSPGYWHNPDLTRTAFISDPATGYTKIYRTGDLGRMRPDGCLEHLGRKDFRVKIRGFSIELEEIEAALRTIPVVRDAIVLVSKDEFPDDRLIAYIIPTRGQTSSVSEIRSYLKDKLPDHMMPSAFMFLEALPLTPTGKLDRQALPKPDQSRPGLDTVFVAPQNSMELQLTKIWEKILGIHPIGARDNFFDLGGNSLRAVQLVTQIEKLCGKPIPPAILFRWPTIAQLASALREEKWPASWSSLVPVQTGGPKFPFFWIHGDNSTALLPRYLGLDQPLYGLEHQSQDGKPARYTQVETIAAHYLEEMRTVQPHGPYFLGGYSFGGIVAFEAAQQLKKDGEEVAFLFLLDSHFPQRGVSRTRIESFRERLRHHSRNIALFGYKDKLFYVLTRVKERIKYTFGQTELEMYQFLKRTVCRIYFSLGRPLPPSLREFYIFKLVYNQASRNYQPKPYLGRAIYIKAENRPRDYQLRWTRLISGEREVHEVPGCNHLEIIEEPHTQFWAEKLKACLSDAQAQINKTCLNYYKGASSTHQSQASESER
ncbi:MAG TPA: alpha/beta fold hydrolase [Candidatus Binatia bacterium]